ncbi:MAG: rRNA pseudouridine synthase [Bacteroidetes bacterium]|nr:rRNA pseudouridine synthase [Bacteroidota bacterium]
MPNAHFNRFGKTKSNAQKKEAIRQEKRAARAEKNAYFEKKKAEKAAEKGKSFVPKKSRLANEEPAQKTAVVKRNATNAEEVMPLNKYLAHCGVCSRRDAAEEIKKGLVKVNGELITEPGYKVTDKDKITFNGKPLQIQHELVYILLNKPKDYITTSDDPQGRKTVLDLIKGNIPQRVYPVGRLDRNTTGVLLLTNDGDLTQKLSHPSYQVKKIYEVTLDKPLEKADFQQLLKGVVLEDGFIAPDALGYADPKNKKIIGVEIHSGRNRIVRRMFEHLGYDVRGLDRVLFANLTKKNVDRGKWRYLNEKEIRLLKFLNKSFVKSKPNSKTGNRDEV